MFLYFPPRHGASLPHRFLHLLLHFLTQPQKPPVHPVMPVVGTHAVRDVPGDFRAPEQRVHAQRFAYFRRAPCPGQVLLVRQYEDRFAGSQQPRVVVIVTQGQPNPRS